MESTNTTPTGKAKEEAGRYSPTAAMSPLERRGFFRAQVGLRVSAVGLCLAALVVMITSHQSVSIFGAVLEARYSYSSAFRFLAGVDGVVCGCSLLSLAVLISLPGSRPVAYYFRLFLHDLAMSLLLTAGCAAGTAIGYVGQYGQSQTGWTAICDDVGKFCHQLTISIALSYAALIFYVTLTILAVMKIKTASGAGMLRDQADIPVVKN